MKKIIGQTMLYIFSLSLLNTAYAANSGSFKECAEFLNEQFPVATAGEHPSGKQIIKMNDNGSWEYAIPATKMGQYTKNSLYDSKIIFHENTGVKEYIDQMGENNMKDAKGYKIDIHDTVKVTKDKQGRVVKVEVTEITGGRGDTIDDEHFMYYNQTTEYHFAYDEKGCYPSAAFNFLSAGNKKSDKRRLFSYPVCEKLEVLWQKMPKTALSSKYDTGEARLVPKWPLPKVQIREFIDALYSEEELKKYAETFEYRLEKLKEDPSDKSSEDTWSMVERDFIEQCHGIEWRKTYKGSNNLRPFMEARGIGIKSNMIVDEVVPLADPTGATQAD